VEKFKKLDTKMKNIKIVINDGKISFIEIEHV